MVYNIPVFPLCHRTVHQGSHEALHKAFVGNGSSVICDSFLMSHLHQEVVNMPGNEQFSSSHHSLCSLCTAGYISPKHSIKRMKFIENFFLKKINSFKALFLQSFTLVTLYNQSVSKFNIQDKNILYPVINN